MTVSHRRTVGYCLIPMQESPYRGSEILAISNIQEMLQFLVF
jgi:hypothetical protein